jgi:NADH dehydrogenase (ubiquinone) Fe-S protein 2
MAFALLRSSARIARTTKTSRLSARSLSVTSRRQNEPNIDRTDGKKSGFDYHTVEDLHGMTAHEILSGPKEDPKMRHFTGVLPTPPFLLGCLCKSIQ